MKIPIRIKEYALKKENSSFDLLGGIINFINIKLIFTNKLMHSGSAFIINDNEIIIVRDVSLMKENGEYKFIDTPEGEHQTSIEISQNIRD